MPLKNTQIFKVLRIQVALATPLLYLELSTMSLIYEKEYLSTIINVIQGNLHNH